jgi:outer membrane autotransporter protein
MLANASATYSNGWSIWTRGFAGQRDQPADGTSLHTLNQYFGGMLGWDMQARNDLRLGVFAGGGETRSSVDQNYGDTKSSIVFAGIYANYTPGAIFWHAALQGGHSLNDSTRNMNNNLAPGGWETAKASYGGTYFSPEATVGTRFALGSLHGAFYTLTPSLKLRYLFASYDSYTETGSSANMSVGARIVHDFEQRAQLKLTGTRNIAANKTVSGSLYAGVLGVQRAGDTTIDSTLLGQPLQFATPGSSSVLGGFGGAGIEFRTGATAFFASAEYLRLSDSSYVLSGRGGIKLSF